MSLKFSELPHNNSSNKNKTKQLRNYKHVWKILNIDIRKFITLRADSTHHFSSKILQVKKKTNTILIGFSFSLHQWDEKSLSQNSFCAKFFSNFYLWNQRFTAKVWGVCQLYFSFRQWVFSDMLMWKPPSFFNNAVSSSLKNKI